MITVRDPGKVIKRNQPATFTDSVVEASISVNFIVFDTENKHIKYGKGKENVETIFQMP